MADKEKTSSAIICNAPNSDENENMIALLALGAITALNANAITAEYACSRLFRPANWKMLTRLGDGELSELFENYSELEDIEQLIPDALDDALDDAHKKLVKFIKAHTLDSCHDISDPNFLHLTESKTEV